MNDRLFARAAEVFLAARTLPLEPRREFLDQQCRADPELRGAVEDLLRGDGLPTPFESLAAAVVQTVDDAASASAPAVDRVGPYQLLDKIGEGGFGTVYLARQDHPLRRDVAVKILKPGMDSRRVIARFEAERQALALMDHPNITRVFDAGACANGRPYFVMELVRGVSITQYSDVNRLSPEERLDLFIPVCQAVHHAHQKGVIHRDIKPGNVMVAVHDGAPVPKVIDFGIAKAIHGRLTDRTLFTEFHQFIGTPEYMSPEQAEMSVMDVDTRTDIYALGVLLYELLTGTSPLRLRLNEASPADYQRIIREVEPPTPSRQISTASHRNGDGRELAARRGTSGAALVRKLRGDLDWIVMKCLEKNRTRRYETADALIQDLLRYRRREPVLAGPPSVLYRLSRLARRHRIALAAGSVVFLALSTGFGVAARGWSEATEQRDAATRSLHQAESEASRFSALAALLRDMVAPSGPAMFRPPGFTARQLLDDCAAGLAARPAQDPLVEATVRLTLGVAFLRLGETERARPLLEFALDHRRRLLPADDPELAEAMEASGRLALDTGSIEDGQRLLDQALDLRRRAAERGPDQRRALVRILSGAAFASLHVGDATRAERLSAEALAAVDETGPEAAEARYTRAAVLRQSGDVAGAEQQLRAGLEVLRGLVPLDRPVLAATLNARPPAGRHRSPGRLRAAVRGGAGGGAAAVP